MIRGRTQKNRPFIIMAYNNKLHLPTMLSMDLHDIFDLYKKEEQETFSLDKMIWYENGFFQESAGKQKLQKSFLGYQTNN